MQQRALFRIWRLLVLVSALGLAQCSGSEEENGGEPSSSSEETPGETASNGPDQTPSGEDPAPEEDGFSSPCLSLPMEGLIPRRLLQLAGPMAEGATLERAFADAAHAPPTETGHQPTGHVFRWTLVEREADRESLSSTGFRERITQLGEGANTIEGYENQQIRTFESRIPTQTQRELVLTVVNSSGPEQRSRVSLRCVDHGNLPALPLAEFVAWQWLPAPLQAATADLSTSSVVQYTETNAPQNASVLTLQGTELAVTSTAGVTADTHEDETRLTYGGRSLSPIGPPSGDEATP